MLFFPYLMFTQFFVVISPTIGAVRIQIKSVIAHQFIGDSDQFPECAPNTRHIVSWIKDFTSLLKTNIMSDLGPASQPGFMRYFPTIPGSCRYSDSSSPSLAFITSSLPHHMQPLAGSFFWRII